jgi:DNA-binding transcriptional ArsR family regulator
MGTSESNEPLGATLFGKTRRAILGLLFGHADESFYLREIVRASGGGVGAVQRELQRLTAAGLVRRTRRGSQVYFQANADCPVFAELKGLVVKTAGLADVVRAALAPLADQIEIAMIYGSLAKGSEWRQSDVDLLVVGGATFAEVVSALGPAQQRIRREVNPTVYPREEFLSKLAAGHHFLTRVLAEPKVFLVGNEDELRRLAEERLAR